VQATASVDGRHYCHCVRRIRTRKEAKGMGTRRASEAAVAVLLCRCRRATSQHRWEDRRAWLSCGPPDLTRNSLPLCSGCSPTQQWQGRLQLAQMGDDRRVSQTWSGCRLRNGCASHHAAACHPIRRCHR
jgi:hypothetical protein